MSKTGVGRTLRRVFHVLVVLEFLLGVLTRAIKTTVESLVDLALEGLAGCV